MSRVAITGSSGYLGTALVRQLASRSDVERIFGLDLHKPRESSEKLTFIRHDVTAGGLERIFSRERVDRAVHLAYIVDPIHDRQKMRRINVDGSRQFLRACSQERIDTMVVASSGTAYGAHPDNSEYLTEDMPLRANPRFQYATEKREVENLVRRFMEQHPTKRVKVIRPCIIYGPNVSNYLARLIERDHVVIIKGCRAHIQLVHEEDCARAVAELLFSGRRGPYNIASDGRISYPQMARLSGKECKEIPAWLMHFGLSVEWLLRSRFGMPPGILPYLRYSWCMDNSRLKREVGFSYRYSTEETMKIFVATRIGSRA